MVSEGVFNRYAKLATAQARYEKELKRYEGGFDYNPMKADIARKRLAELSSKEEELLSKFTDDDIERYEEYFGVPFES